MTQSGHRLRAARRVPRLGAAALLAAATSCAVFTDSTPAPARELEVGTWGGLGLAAIVSDSQVHVHFGCTIGEFVRPTRLDSAGRFVVDGRYVIRAFPVQLGPSLPARFTGLVRGRQLTLSVAVDDTVER
jgi:hypothetical protein